MTNDTMRKFNYPDSLLREYEHWVVLLRPAQVTVGSLVLANRGQAQRFPDLPADAFSELREAAADLEAALSRAFGYDKMNYLMLMMVDPHVHYHVIPRYSEPVRLAGREFTDAAWPGPPDVTRSLELGPDETRQIRERIESAWPQ
ncbi:MAG TPA: HIT domain-containing protein [Arenicellales bacterium]|nr:HIT domain-containing protein [Arenicellales bacterium]